MNDSLTFFPAMSTFRSRLRAGELLIGAGVTLNDPLISEVLADSVDFLWYDLEHMQIDPASMNAHLMAARGRATPSIVRVRDVSAIEVKPALDAGADGIVAPQVKSVEQIKEFVSNSRYPPVGRRGLFPRASTNFGRKGDAGHFEAANENIFVSVMIETKEAVDAIDEIVRLPGLDSIVLGLGDLSGSLGKLVDFENPELHEYVDRVLAAAGDVGMPVGVGSAFSIEFARSMVARGVTWVQFGSDFEYMIHSIDDATASLREKT